MDIFTLAAKLSLDTKEFEKGITKQERGFKQFGDKLVSGFDKIKKAATLLVSGVAVKKAADAMHALVSETASMGDKIDKQSQALGLSRKAYQEWDYILSQSGASIDSLGISMKTLNSAILSGGSDTNKALKELGLSAGELKDLGQEQAFEKVVRAFQRLPASAEKSALAVKLFGRNGQDLLPLLNSDIYSIDMLRLKAKDLGLIMSDEAVDASVAYTDALDTLNRTFNGLKYSIGAKALPVLTQFFTNATNYAAKLKRAYDNNGIAGVFQTLISDIKNNIKWPTWKDVRKAAEDAWEGIKKGVSDFGGLVFGKNEEGKVNWPSFDQAVEWARVNIWEGIILKGVKGFGGLIFGKDENGEVNWPKDFGEALEWARVNIWENIIQKGIKNFGGLIFGTDEEGNVQWPDVEKLVTSFNDWWQNTTLPALQKGMVWALTLFGMPEEDAGQITTLIGDWWKGKVKFVEDVLHWALHLPDSPHEAGEELGRIIGEWWEGVKGFAQGVLKWTLGLFGIFDKDGERTVSMLGTWWENNVKPFLKDVINFTLGLFGLPSVEDMKNSIIEWWESVKDAVGNLFVNIIPNILGIGGSDDNGFTTDEEGGRHHTGVEGHFAKGAWNIPYDNFRATLHRNEMVLSASQARQYREGNAGGANNAAVIDAVNSLKGVLSNLSIQVAGREFGRAAVRYGGNPMSNYLGTSNKQQMISYGTR